MKEQKPTSTKGVQGEGDYESARVYRRDVGKFVREKDARIPDLAKQAEDAVEGPEGAELQKAEEKGKSKARH
jgi:hypothetical protein